MSRVAVRLFKGKISGAGQASKSGKQKESNLKATAAATNIFTGTTTDILAGGDGHAVKSIEQIVWHNLGQQDFNYFHSIFSLYKLWWHVLHLSVDLRENKFISFQKEVFLFLSLYFMLGGQPGVAWDFCCMLSLSLSLSLSPDYESR